MNTQDRRSGQGGPGAQQDTQQGFQQGSSTQAGRQPQQYSPGGGQHGSQLGGGQDGAEQGGPYGGSGQQGAQRAQQEAYSQTRGQPGSPSGRRGGGMPSLFGRGGSPVEMLRRLDEDMDRLFQQFWGGGRNLMRGRGTDVQSMWAPQVEMCEQGGKLHVYADLPGMRKEDVRLSIEGDQLILQGERRSSHEEGQPGSGFYHTERSYGTFYRSIPLPEGIDPQTVDASFRDGVLDVCFDAPRAPQQQSRQVEIRDGASGMQGATGGGSQGGGNRTPGMEV
jgi:HSP20 family protein